MIFTMTYHLYLKEWKLKKVEKLVVNLHDKTESDLLTDIDMLSMVEKGIRGRTCHSIYRYAKTNSKYMKDHDYYFCLKEWTLKTLKSL